MREKYYPQNKILKTLLKTGAIAETKLLDKTKKFLPKENHRYAKLVDILCELYAQGLVNAEPAPNIKDPNSTFSITAKGMQKLQEIKENKFRFWLPVIISIIALIGAYRQELVWLLKATTKLLK